MYRQVPPVDRKMMQKINQNNLLNLIRLHAPVSRTQLKSLSGLSQGTIFGMTATLLEQQLIVETGAAQSTGGRKAELLEIHPDGGYVLGIELREYELILVLLNLHGKVVAVDNRAVVLRDNAINAVSIIVEEVELFIATHHVSREKIFGLGCGVSGPVNRYTGTIVDSWILNWHGVELAEPLHEKLHMPVLVDNSVNCLISFEKLYRNGKKYQNFLLVTLGRGLGMAAILRDVPFRGALGLGGEFGHIPFDSNGRICECGNQGCLEAYVGDKGILTTYRELCTVAQSSLVFEPELTVQDIACQALAGKQEAYRAFELTGTYLGLGLASLVNLFNPECIVLCNDGVNSIELLLDPMKTSLKRHTFSQLDRDMDLIIEPNTTRTYWARGAGCLVLQDFFSLSEQF